MPNWVINKVSFQCSDGEFAGIIERYWNQEEEEFLDFTLIIPRPPDLYMGDVRTEMVNGQFRHYPENNWYDWSINNWGTKWNSTDGYIDDDEHTLYFQTAWSAPYPIIQKLAELTGLSLIHEYADGDIGSNVNRLTYAMENGILVIDDENIRAGSDEAYRLGISLWGLEDLYRNIDGEWVYVDDIFVNEDDPDDKEEKFIC